MLPPSRPPVVADRVRVMTVDDVLSAAAAVAPRGEVVVITGGMTEDSVDRRPKAGVEAVAVTAGGVSGNLVPKGGGREPSGCAMAGTREKRLEREAGGGVAASAAAIWIEEASAGVGDEDDEAGARCEDCGCCEEVAWDGGLVVWAWSRDKRWVAEFRR